MKINDFVANNKKLNLTYSVLKNYSVANAVDIQYLYEKVAFAQNGWSGGRILINEYNLPKDINNFLEECLIAYPESMNSYQLYMMKGYPPSITSRHKDPTDVLHWQCLGSATWEIEDSEGNINSITLNPGDLLWLKDFSYHSVLNVSLKYSVIFATEPDEKTYPL